MTDWYMKNLGWIHARDELLYYRLLNLVEPRPEVDWSIVDDMMRPKEWLFGEGPFMPSQPVLMYGFGDGNHIMYALDKMDKQAHLIILVPDIPEFLEMMHVEDLEPLLKDPRALIVLYGQNNDMLLRYIGACFNPHTISHTKVLMLPDYDVLYPEGITFLEQALGIMMQWMRD